MTDLDHHQVLGNGSAPCVPTAPCGHCDDCSEADGAQILDDVHAAYRRFVAFPSPEVVDAVTLFTAATHAQLAWEHATRLVIKSPVKRCGKSRLQEVAGELCHKPLKTTNISPAALVRSIGLDDPPTVMLDEADAVFATRRGERSEGAEDLRGLLNSGHSRGWPYIRWDATARKPEECPTFAMAIIGGIGDMPDTIEDRAVVVSMRRRAPGEHVDPFRRRRSVAPLRALRERLHAWMRSEVEALSDAEPDLPVEDRAADVWEPLVAVADLAGGDWPKRARAACAALVGIEADEEEGTAGERLLADLREILAEPQLSTTVILERLSALEEAPWSKWSRGEPLSARSLATLLKPYGVRSRNVRTADGQSKGYWRADLLDSWERYLGDQETWDGSEKNIRPTKSPCSDQGIYAPRDVGTAGTQGRLGLDTIAPSPCRVCSTDTMTADALGPVHPLCLEPAR